MISRRALLTSSAATVVALCAPAIASPDPDDAKYDAIIAGLLARLPDKPTAIIHLANDVILEMESSEDDDWEEVYDREVPKLRGRSVGLRSGPGRRDLRPSHVLRSLYRPRPMVGGISNGVCIMANGVKAAIIDKCRAALGAGIDAPFVRVVFPTNADGEVDFDNPEITHGDILLYDKAARPSHIFPVFVREGQPPDGFVFDPSAVFDWMLRPDRGAEESAR